MGHLRPRGRRRPTPGLQDAARQAGWTVEDSVCTVEIPATEKLSLRVQATLLPFTEEAARLQLTGFATVSQSEEMEAFF